jgi:histidine triad (HIT) family protein
VFCRIAGGVAPAEVVASDINCLVIVPLKPVTPGHVLVIPRVHVADFTAQPMATARVMSSAAWYAKGIGPCNVITSKGREATQSVFHLHLHVIPRAEGDGLALPWYSGKRRKRVADDGD